ncbi:MAG: hypothetical protein JXR60_03610 [Bacteroidales bacterium]|nr:hypothetical protein [Bacteroidales bacterium]
MSKCVLLISVFLILASFGSLQAHPIHVTVVNMDITNEGVIQFSVKIFADDFGTILSKENKRSITFSEVSDIEKYQKAIVVYIDKNFKISDDDNQIYSISKVDRSELKENAVWLYFTVQPKATNIQSLNISNQLMCDLFDDQTNLMILSYKGKELANRFTFKNQNFKFVL